MHAEQYKKHLKNEWEIKKEANIDEEEEEILSNSEDECNYLIQTYN